MPRCPISLAPDVGADSFCNSWNRRSRRLQAVLQSNHGQPASLQTRALAIFVGHRLGLAQAGRQAKYASACCTRARWRPPSWTPLAALELALPGRQFVLRCWSGGNLAGGGRSAGRFRHHAWQPVRRAGSRFGATTIATLEDPASHLLARRWGRPWWCGAEQRDIVNLTDLIGEAPGGGGAGRLRWIPGGPCGNSMKSVSGRRPRDDRCLGFPMQKGIAGAPRARGCSGICAACMLENWRRRRHRRHRLSCAVVARGDGFPASCRRGCIDNAFVGLHHTDRALAKEEVLPICRGWRQRGRRRVDRAGGLPDGHAPVTGSWIGPYACCATPPAGLAPTTVGKVFVGLFC